MGIQYDQQKGPEGTSPSIDRQDTIVHPMTPPLPPPPHSPPAALEEPFASSTRSITGGAARRRVSRWPLGKRQPATRLCGRASCLPITPIWNREA